MKNVLLGLMLAFSSMAFAQGACDTKIDAKSYTVKLVVIDKAPPAQPGTNGKLIKYNIEITNNSKIMLDFEPTIWGAKEAGKQDPKSLGKGKKESAGPGAMITIPGSATAFSIDEVKLLVTKTDCKVNGKNTFMDPTFYKAVAK